jgi:serine/tyrosine/threonine adenylyltransferase
VPVDTIYLPDPRHASLGADFFDPVRPADFPKAVTRFRNQRWAARMGLGALTETEWTAHFGQFKSLPDNLPQPLALRYHGHQFRSYNPDIGDGRGFLFAQLRDPVDGRLLDLATKGSGRTPWSRRGDGRLTLKGGIREVLATEMLEALGVYTSKSFSLIETGEALQRGDEPSPTRSSVLVRLGHSHVRFGTFQRFAALQDEVNMRRLIDYSIATYWPEAARAPDPVLAFFACVVDAMAMLAAEWFAAGFVHGVLNTDNMTITGESFDYGPWRFLPVMEPGFTAAYFDETGLYAFARQPNALAWNLARLAECLLPFSAHAGLSAELDRFAPAFDAALEVQTLARLGLTSAETRLAVEFHGALRVTKLPFERASFDCVGGARQDRLMESPHRENYFGPDFAKVLALLRAAKPVAVSALNNPYFRRNAPVTMLIEDVEAIWSAIDTRDDWSLFQTKIDDIRHMGAAYAPLMPSRAGHKVIA